MVTGGSPGERGGLAGPSKSAHSPSRNISGVRSKLRRSVWKAPGGGHGSRQLELARCQRLETRAPLIQTLHRGTPGAHQGLKPLDQSARRSSGTWADFQFSLSERLGCACHLALHPHLSHKGPCVLLLKFSSSFIGTTEAQLRVLVEAPV